MNRAYRRLSSSEPSVESLKRRAAKLEVCLQVLRPEIAVAMADAPESEWIFGRLFLLGLLNQAQYDAALHVGRTLRRYRTLLAPHGRIKGWQPESVRTVGGEDLSPEADRRMQAAREEYLKVCTALATAGGNAMQAVFGALEDDAVPDLRAVHAGLNAILLRE